MKTLGAFGSTCCAAASGIVMTSGVCGNWRSSDGKWLRFLPIGPCRKLPMTHEIFHAFFDINKVIQVPNVRNGEIWKLSGGRTPTWEQPDDTEPRVFGISD